jgi:hypothetical protein
VKRRRSMERNRKKMYGQFAKNILRMVIRSASKFAKNYIRFRKTQQKRKGMHEREVMLQSSVRILIINVTS